MPRWKRQPLASVPEALVDRSMRLPASLASVDALHAQLGTFWQEVAALGSDYASGDHEAPFTTAVIETATNVIRHALREQPSEQFQVSLLAFADHIEARFHDRGAQMPERPAATQPGSLDELPEGGYGLVLIHASVDVVEYKRAGGHNEWRLIKRL